MKKKEKRLILILVVILIIVVIIGIVNGNKKDNGTGNEGNTGAAQNGVSVENGVVEEFVQKQDDGTKKNISSKLSETKKFDGFELTNIVLTEKDNLSSLTGTITNVSSETRGEYLLDIVVLDKEGNEIITTHAYVQKLEPGQSAQLDASTTYDYANAYDIIVKKSEE